MKFFLVFYSLTLGVCAIEKPKDISEEMFCLGCQVTVKELDFMLSKKPTRGMGETVTRALKRVCDVHNFNKYDVDAKKVLQVCKHIRGDEGMEAVLISEYGRKHAIGKKTTYLDITQMICGTVLKACDEIQTLSSSDVDGGITFDPVSEDFQIKHGKKVRVPHPVSEPGSDPNETKGTESTDITQAGETLQTTERAETAAETVVTNDGSDSHDEL